MTSPHRDSDDDSALAALYATPISASPETTQSRIAAALAAYDLTLRSHARRSGRERFPRFGAVAASVVMVCAGVASGFLLGRESGSDGEQRASMGSIATVPIRGTDASCAPEGGLLVGTVTVGNLEVTIGVDIEPAVRVRLIDARTCEVIVVLP